MTPGALVLTAIAVLQVALAVRVVTRLVRTAGGTRIEPARKRVDARSIAVIVPVLDEQARLAQCLEGLVAQGDEVATIVVADGGSRDGTQNVVSRYAARDERVRLVSCGPPAPEWTGKIWNLATALRQVDPTIDWVLSIDADVRPRADLARALITHATRVEVRALSVATRQRLSGPAEGLVHPACLATLVYRFGIPGHATRDVAAVQANGQCFLARRSDLVATCAFGAARTSICEDVTIARTLAAAGLPVGFYEAGDLVDVAMYGSWRDAWDNWPRSLPMRDHYFGLRGWLGFAEILAVQALPLPAFVAAGALGLAPAFLATNAALAAVRLGVLVGMARAYARRPWTYWFSPLADLPIAVRVVQSALRRRHAWRGRAYRRIAPGQFHLVEHSQGGE